MSLAAIDEVEDVGAGTEELGCDCLGLTGV